MSIVMKGWLYTLLALVFLLSVGEAARGRGMGRRGSRRRSGNRFELPGQNSGSYLDKESRKYYGNPDGARVITASHFESEYILGRKIVFICVAKGTPVPQITWFKNGIELYAHAFFQIHEWKIAENQIKSKMEIDPATQKDAGVYECEANNRFSVDRRAFRTDYAIEFE